MMMRSRYLYECNTMSVLKALVAVSAKLRTEQIDTRLLLMPMCFVFYS